MVVEYRIDVQDRLVSVSGAWARFALDNDAPELAEPVLGDELWSSFASAEVRGLWQMIVGHARRVRLPISLSFRCDGPATMRWCELEVEADADGSHVGFRSVIVREEEREAVELLRATAVRDGSAPMVRACGWCARFSDGSTWMTVDRFVMETGLLDRTSLPGITHGICESCEETVLQSIDPDPGPDPEPEERP